MSFNCCECDEKISNSKMAGMAITRLAKAVLEERGISTSSALSSAFDRGEFSAGLLTGLVDCPKCKASNWK